MRICSERSYTDCASMVTTCAGQEKTNRSAADLSLLQLATREKRTLITYDTDFGEIIYRGNRHALYGIILFRMHVDVPEEVRMLFVVGTITSWDPWPPGIWTVQIRHQS